MKEQISKIITILFNLISGLFIVVMLLLAATIFLQINPSWSLIEDENNVTSLTDEIPDYVKIKDGKDTKTGLLDGKGIELVVLNCTRCHSAKLITQNRATREGWHAMIKWMQKTQNLGDLGENEPAILDYLAKYYAPAKEGRRRNLMEIEWYPLDE